MARKTTESLVEANNIQTGWPNYTHKVTPSDYQPPTKGCHRPQSAAQACNHKQTNCMMKWLDQISKSDISLLLSLAHYKTIGH